MKNTIKINYIYNLAYQILAIIIPLITTPYISRVLGVNGVGEYNYTSGIVSYFGLIAATGTVNFAQRELSVYENNKQERSRIFWEIFFFRCICSSVVLISYTVFTFDLVKQYRLLYIIQYLTVFSWIVDISWYFQGTENFKATAIRNCIIKIVGTILIFIFVKHSNDLWIYTLILSMMTLLGNLTMWKYIVGEVAWLGFSKIKIFKDTKEILQLFLPVISIQLYTVLDKTMLGTMSSTLEVGYYSQAEKIIKLALTLLSSLIAVMLPRVSMLYKTENYKDIQILYNKTVNFIFLLALPMIAGCIMVSDEFVPIFFGKGYEPVAQLMKIESLLFIILSLGQLFGNFLVAMNKQTGYTIAVTLAAVVNILFNTIFIHFFSMGSTGAVIASILAEIVSTSIQFIYVKDLLKIASIIKAFFRYVIPTIIMAVAIFTIRIFFKGYLSLLFSVGVGGVIYFVILIIIKDEIIISILNQMLDKLNISRD